jgi:RimJ/RimL family protein N-acetyltransferase
MTPRSPADFPFLLDELAQIPANTTYAEAVLRGHVAGHVFTDQATDPSLFVIAHPCGMSLLIARGSLAEAAEFVRRYCLNEGGFRHRPEYLQLHPAAEADAVHAILGAQLVDGRDGSADATMKTLLREKAIRWDRLNFEFNAAHFLSRVRRPLPAGFRVGRVGRDAFEWSEGAVLPRAFWDSADDFERRATAFAVFQGDQPVSVAFSAFALPSRLEIGIETRPEWRGRGLATEACAGFIEHCLQQQLTPLWSCRKGNAASERTALGLGFELSGARPYFALKH